jgi:hypothetical protein
MENILNELWLLIKNNFSNTLLIGIVGFMSQRYYKLKDEYKSEKNKHYAEHFTNGCNKLFELIVEIRNKLQINSNELITLSTKIKQLTKKNYLYLPDEIINICHNYSDYLLEIHVNVRERDLKYEDDLLKKFKKEFKK